MLKKAAILDSDFIIKTSLTRNSKNEGLSDVVLKLPYSFTVTNKIEQKLQTMNNLPQLGWIKI